jgi:hypothetical protein
MGVSKTLLLDAEANIISKRFLSPYQNNYSFMRNLSSIIISTWHELFIKSGHRLTVNCVVLPCLICWLKFNDKLIFEDLTLTIQLMLEDISNLIHPEYDMLIWINTPEFNHLNALTLSLNLVHGSACVSEPKSRRYKNNSANKIPTCNLWLNAL